MNPKITTIIGVLVLGVLAVFVLSRTVFRKDFPLPQGGETKKEIITVPGEDQPFSTNGFDKLTTREIMVTNGTKHSVPLDEIIGGGPPKDGIPSID